MVIFIIIFANWCSLWILSFFLRPILEAKACGHFFCWNLTYYFGFLGAPGTPLPRNLVRKLYDSNIGQNNQFNIRDQQQFAEMMLKNHQFLSEFAGLSLADSVSAYNGMIPPGAPTSPPSTGASHAHFFDHNGHGNMRFMAPPTMSMQSPLFNYYGGL